MQPHFALSAIFLLGLRGITKQIPLPFPPVSQQQAMGDKADVKLLATSLETATERMMREGSIAREILGDAFVEHFGGTRMHEVKVWNEVVTNWECESVSECSFALLCSAIGKLTGIFCHSGTLYGVGIGY